MDPYQVTRDFEAALCKYTGASYAVAVNSCTSALQLSMEWFARSVLAHQNLEVSIPRRTYPSVASAVQSSGLQLSFDSRDWVSCYRIKPLPVWDCARKFTGGMYRRGQFQCVSFASSKILGIEQGGAILHDSPGVDGWFRRMRFDGRTEGKDLMHDKIHEAGHHMIMLPSIAAQALLKLSFLPRHNKDMPKRKYPDLSRMNAWSHYNA